MSPFSVCKKKQIVKLLGRGEKIPKIINYLFLYHLSVGEMSCPTLSHPVYLGSLT